MANNIDFISSIKNESDFEEVVRQLAKHIYNAEAYLIGGPYDGGRDLVYKRMGKEVKEAVQISIQKQGIDSKILADAKKTLGLVKEHQYPEKLTFFWSHPLTASHKLTIKKSVRDNTGIELDIFDATEIDQIITSDAPEILKYVLEEIHQYKTNGHTNVDVKARAFYDYLALSKDSAELKTSIIDAQILSNLFSQEMDKAALIIELGKFNIKSGAAESRIDSLRRAGKIEAGHNNLVLSEKEKVRLDNIINKDEAQRKQILQRIKQFTETEIGSDLSDRAFDLIRRVYSASVEIQISEISITPPKLSIAKSIVNEIELLIKANNSKSSLDVRKTAKKLIEIASENEYLSNYCSSLLCINLLKQKKLQRYIQDKSFFIYLDATVFIRYLALYGFSQEVNYDKEMQITANLRDAIRSLKNTEIRITQEHLEETIRHITQAEKISSFANDALISRFGDSKNVYFNLYLKSKKQNGHSYSFDNFLDKLIGYEKQLGFSGNNFSLYMECVLRYLRLASITVMEYQNADTLETDPTARKILRNYEAKTYALGKPRKFRSTLNDLTACYIMGDTYLHTDKNGIGHTPIFITWDSTQHDLRAAYREENVHDEWIIYTPQRALERFSMLQFEMNGEILKDNVLAIIDEDYIKESSLIDTLAAFLGEDKIESDAIISILTKLTGKIHNEPSDLHQFDAESKSVINVALLALQNSFRDSFADIRKLFSDPTNEETLVALLDSFVTGRINQESLTSSVGKLLPSVLPPAL